MRTILHVGSDPATRARIARELGARGYEVRSARDRDEALARFRHEPIDALLVDLDAGESVALCHELKALAREFLPAVSISREEDPARAMRAGFDDAWREPLAIDECEARLSVLLRLRDRERRLREETGKFRTIAFTDALTRLGNRRAFEAELARAWARSSRRGEPFALLLVDIDRFKLFNDRHGHRTGDAVLRAVGRVLARRTRAGDQAFRIGGEELAVIAPDAEPAGVRGLGERLREAIAAERVSPPPGATWYGPLAVTASIGIAIAPSAAIATPEALIEAADRALYAAKEGGRDRVVAFDSISGRAASFDRASTPRGPTT